MVRRLASPLTAMKPHYDVVVIGSGYGGGVAAARLARCGLAVAVLERGRELLPGEMPDRLLAAQKQLQVTGRAGRLGSEGALFEVRLGDDIHVMMACGLGGGSLINANVCLTPDPRVFEDPVWPEEIRHDGALADGYVAARHMLRPGADEKARNFQKVQALQTAAGVFGRGVEPVPLHIAFTAGPNAAGVHQPACTRCGDCCGGCNVGAKTTVAATYIADAVANGASVFTEIKAQAVIRSADGKDWQVTYHAHAGGEGTVIARTVVIAAGTLGSTEILLRSRESGLAVSDKLGERFTSNGDAIAIAYNNRIAVNGIGVGHPPRVDGAPVGAAVNGLLDLRNTEKLEDGLAIVECALPSSLAPMLPALLGAGSAVFGQQGPQSLRDELDELGRATQSLIKGAWRSAVHNTQTFLAVGHDSGDGRMRLEQDRLLVEWSGGPKQAVFERIESTLKKATAATGGTYMRNPASERLMGGNLLTVHPLGGCVMATDRRRGVVDHKCRVFDAGAESSGAVHEGLYVCDGSVLPRSLGVHPLLTITAVAERAMAMLARDRGLTISTTPPVPEPAPDAVVAALPRTRSIWQRMFGG